MQTTDPKTNAVELAITTGLAPGAKLRENRLFVLTATGVQFQGQMNLEQFIQALNMLRLADTSLQVWLADFLSHGRRQFGDVKVQEVLAQLEFPELLVNRAAGIASLAEGVRRAGLTSEHYWVLAKTELTGDQQNRWAGLAVAHKLNAAQLLASIKAGKVVKPNEHGTKSLNGGVATVQGFRAIFDTWFQRVEDRDPIHQWPEERLHELWDSLKGPTQIGLQIARRLGIDLEKRSKS